MVVSIQCSRSPVLGRFFIKGIASVKGGRCGGYGHRELEIAGVEGGRIWVLGIVIGFRELLIMPFRVGLAVAGKGRP